MLDKLKTSLVKNFSLYLLVGSSKCKRVIYALNI